MASQVLVGSSNVTYTNNTGQNVRLVINYMNNCTSMTWGGISISGTVSKIGKTMTQSATFPCEIFLAANQAFSAVCAAYNIVVVKEDGT
jgi:hypothetical protein